MGEVTSLRRQKRATRPRFRTDIEGLRGIAILLVVGFHAGVPGLGGGFVGVDVFFVISGFLMTKILVGPAGSDKAPRLRDFYARRVRRILPAAASVLFVTGIASAIWLPWIDRSRVAWDLFSSALMTANIRFALESTDYLASEAAASPVLNYWSLSVEEQFYIVWPALLLLALFAGRKRIGRGLLGATPALIIALVIVSVVSFVLNLWLMEQNQPWAFFGMPSRAWEFAAGGFVAIMLRRGTSPAAVPSAILGMTGILLVLWAGFAMTTSTPFPGWNAVMPVLGTVLLLWCGSSSRSSLSSRALSSRPLRAIGRVSYSWYLWHWPLLVLVAYAVKSEELSAPISVVVVLAALVPAYLTYRFIENPVRTVDGWFSTNRGAVAIALASVIAVSSAAALLLLLPRPDFALDGNGRTQDSMNSTVRVQDIPRAAELSPALQDARDDLPAVYGDSCHLEVTEIEAPDCVYGDRSGDTTLMLVGDSHAAQWIPALDSYGKQSGIRVLSRTKSACSLGSEHSYLGEPHNRPYRECATWLGERFDEIAETPPDLVLISGRRPDALTVDRGLAPGSALDNLWRASLTRSLARLSSITRVAVLADTPYPGIDIPKCLAQAGDNQECSVPRASAEPSEVDQLSAVAAQVDFLDLNDAICSEDLCESIRSNWIVWRDKHHLTASYSRALARELGRQTDVLLAK